MSTSVLTQKMTDGFRSPSRTAFYFFTLTIWPRFPRFLQFGLSRLFGVISSRTISRFFIPWYVRLNFDQNFEWNRFVPASGHATFRTFQDFFTRRLRHPLIPDNSPVWPCEGLLCQVTAVAGADADNTNVVVKGESRPLRSIFTPFVTDVPEGYYFTNVFLHNRDYHRIHAPVTGHIVSIERIPGELRLLRPWAYQSSPSEPALTNERVNIKLRDEQDRPWFLSIVGGPGVATIILDAQVNTGKMIKSGAELATFRLGSTCCMASPERTSISSGTSIRVGTRYC